MPLWLLLRCVFCCVGERTRNVRNLYILHMVQMNVHVLLFETDDFTEHIPYSQSSLTFTSDTRCPVCLDSCKRRFNV